MAYEAIGLDIDAASRVATITLNRPDKLNSFTQAMHLEVRDALARLQADRSARVLVLTGAGRGICAGQDLSDRAVEPGDEVEIGQVHPELLGDRPDPGQRRHLGAAAPGRASPRAGPHAHRRTACGRQSRRLGSEQKNQKKQKTKHQKQHQHTTTKPTGEAAAR